MRAAIYFTPPAADRLTRNAAEWLGRDAFSGAPTREPDPAIDPLVAVPASYGFHATMKAPFRLAEGRSIDELDANLAAFCETRVAVPIGHLVLRRLGRFFALVAQQAHPPLADLADATVREFDSFRAPPTEAEIARRAPEKLTPRQRALFAEWGYPHVFEEFRFHMSLTGPVGDEAADRVEALLAERLAAAIDRPLAVDRLALFVQPGADAPFRLHSFRPLLPVCRTIQP